MVIVLRPGYRVVLVDGTTHFVAEPPTMGSVEILRDLLGWQAHYDAHTMTVELRSPACNGGCETTTRAEGAVTVADCRD